jgi:3-deoxy-D-manno-octulosonate 8-phosphate phosphatase (KDO 8-P phosphatase)
MATTTSEEIIERAKRIRFLAFDVDGVMTDGRIFYGPEGEALHGFHVRDGMALILARKAGLHTAVITGRVSKNVHARLAELKVPHIQQGIARKASCLDGLLKDMGCTWEQAAYLGDDINDIPCLKKVGLAGVVPNAARGLEDHAHWVGTVPGGHGAVREFIELVMRAQDSWPSGDPFSD